MNNKQVQHLSDKKYSQYLHLTLFLYIQIFTKYLKTYVIAHQFSPGYFPYRYFTKSTSERRPTTFCKSLYVVTLFFGASSNRHMSSELMLLKDEQELFTMWGASLNSSSSSSSADEGPASRKYCSERVGHSKWAMTQYAKQSAE